MEIAAALGKAAYGVYQRGRAEKEKAEQRERFERERERLADKYKDIHGSSDWASVPALRKSELLGSAEDFGRLSTRVPIGPLAVWADREKPLDNPHPDHFAYWDADKPGHFLTVGGTRSGKEASQIIPTLLHYPGSCVVVDPKGESYKATAGWRHLQGSRIIRIAPFDEEGITDAFNPLDYVRDEADARTLAEVLIEREANTGEGKFFENEAINFLTGVILFVTRYSTTERRNLAEVRRYTVVRPRAEIIEFLERMAYDSHPVVSGAGQIALERAQAGGGRDKLIELFRSMDAEVALWSGEGVQRATRSSDFNLTDLKSDIVTVYLEMPFRHMESHGAFLRAFFTQAADAMMDASAELETPVLFMIDEFPAMGHMDSLVTKLNHMYGYGARFWFFAQTLGQIQETYPDKWRQIMETAALKQFLNVRPPSTEIISKELGNKTVMQETIGHSDNYGHSHTDIGNTTNTGGVGGNEGMNFVGRPLLTPDEVERWLNGTRPDNPRLGLLTLAIAADLRFCVNRPFWFLDSNLTAMVERGQQHLEETDRETLGAVYRP